MTVKELVEFLSGLPQDLPIVYCCCSDYVVLEAQAIKVQKFTDELTYGTAVPHHNLPGEYRAYSGEWEYKGSPLPTPANVVIFPGN